MGVLTRSLHDSGPSNLPSVVERASRRSPRHVKDIEPRIRTMHPCPASLARVGKGIMRPCTVTYTRHPRCSRPLTTDPKCSKFRIVKDKARKRQDFLIAPSRYKASPPHWPLRLCPPTSELLRKRTAAKLILFIGMQCLLPVFLPKSPFSNNVLSKKRMESVLFSRFCLHRRAKECNRRKNFATAAMKDITLSLYLQAERLRTARNRANNPKRTR